MTDHLKGAWMRFKGDLKQRWGKIIGDELQQIEGGYEKVIGMLQERYGDTCIRLVRERYGEAKHELIQWAVQWQRRSQPEVRKEKICSQEVIKKRDGSPKDFIFS
jgi:uncharacterized protein YjbJ (UPF0337 family)